MQTAKPLQWHVQQNNESVFVKLSGDLTRDTLLPLWKQRASFLSPKDTQHIYWDLSDLKQIDSAGFTLLIELLHQYQKHSSNCLINPPEAINTLADLFDLNNWLSPFLTCKREHH